MIFSYPFSFDKADPVILEKLEIQGKKLMNNYNQNVIVNEKFMKSKNKTAYFESFNSQLAKPILDEIDSVLAEHYGFTEEELDFIINYDIKYRMGKELEEE